MTAYTVKQVAAISGVSVRTLHFYDETGLLKPAYHRPNRYRFYEEPQLLRLQQILFYRELGFPLKKIKEVLGRPDFETVAALGSHRKVLETSLTRMRTLIQTIDKTVGHLNGAQTMKSEEMFTGFRVGAGNDRFGEHIKLGGESLDCKVSARDTDGAMCVFEFTAGWPRHLHRDQDEWIYVVDGEVAFEVGEKPFRLHAGESVFIPRNVAHVWTPAGSGPAKVINVYHPAGNLEEFFRTLSKHKDIPSREQVMNKSYTEEQKDALARLFDAHGMDLLGPPLLVE
jgi:DNA-binding transcriptional MerR regulator/quercetin dioxygenase-like cupin family protein